MRPRTRKRKTSGRRPGVRPRPRRKAKGTDIPTPLKTAACALAWLALLPLSASAADDYLQAPDRIEWTSGALYDGRFEDGTVFQLVIPALSPPAMKDFGAGKFHPSYWYPRFYKGTPVELGVSERNGGKLRLTKTVPSDCDCGNPREDETFAVDLDPGEAAGRGRWTSVSPKKEMDFTLERMAVYKSVVVQRPFVDRASGKQRPGRDFLFEAIFPVTGDAAADAWIRAQAASCEYDQQCQNRVRISWRSDELLSLEASVWGYSDGAADSTGFKRTRHYKVVNGQLAALDFASFIKPDKACRAGISKAIVAALSKQKMSWAVEGALKDGQEPDFTATPRGIAFHFDPNEVGSYAQGTPTAFVPLKPGDRCVVFLPGSR